MNRFGIAVVTFTVATMLVLNIPQVAKVAHKTMFGKSDLDHYREHAITLDSIFAQEAPIPVDVTFTRHPITTCTINNASNTKSIPFPHDTMALRIHLMEITRNTIQLPRVPKSSAGRILRLVSIVDCIIRSTDSLKLLLCSETITHFQLRDCRIDFANFMALLNSLSKSSVTHLDLSDNVFIGKEIDDGQLGNVLVEYSKLKVLKLDGYRFNIYSVNIQSILQAILRHPSLEDVSLQNCNFTHMEALAEVVSTTIKKLNLLNSWSSDKLLQKLVDRTPNLTSLTVDSIDVWELFENFTSLNYLISNKEALMLIPDVGADDKKTRVVNTDHMLSLIQTLESDNTRFPNQQHNISSLSINWGEKTNIIQVLSTFTGVQDLTIDLQKCSHWEPNFGIASTTAKPRHMPKKLTLVLSNLDETPCTKQAQLVFSLLKLFQGITELELKIVDGHLNFFSTLIKLIMQERSGIVQNWLPLFDTGVRLELPVLRKVTIHNLSGYIMDVLHDFFSLLPTIETVALVNVCFTGYQSVLSYSKPATLNVQSILIEYAESTEYRENKMNGDMVSFLKHAPHLSSFKVVQSRYYLINILISCLDKKKLKRLDLRGYTYSDSNSVEQPDDPLLLFWLNVSTDKHFYTEEVMEKGFVKIIK